MGLSRWWKRSGEASARGTYGGDELYQYGIRASFAQGFGAVPEQYRRAMLWTYDTFFHQRQTIKTWNATTVPMWAAFAFLNWPMGETPQNPTEVLPHILVDTDHGYYVARNRWQDSNDIIVTFLSEIGPKGYYAAV